MLTESRKEKSIFPPTETNFFCPVSVFLLKPPIQEIPQLFETRFQDASLGIARFKSSPIFSIFHTALIAKSGIISVSKASIFPV